MSRQLPPSIDAEHWRDWRPQDVATLLFVRDRGPARILLIRKKRGLGAGKINGPGGRVEAGERIAEAARRELREELVIEADEVHARGVLRFQFLDGYALQVFVFVTERHRGRPRETDEALPLWTAEHEIPFDQMWQDDRLWFRHLLADRTFRGRFFFDGEAMGAHDVELCSDEKIAEEVRRAERRLGAQAPRRPQ